MSLNKKPENILYDWLTTALYVLSMILVIDGYYLITNANEDYEFYVGIFALIYGVVSFIKLMQSAGNKEDK